VIRRFAVAGLQQAAQLAAASHGEVRPAGTGARSRLYAAIARHTVLGMIPLTTAEIAACSPGPPRPAPPRTG
jgi:hypothetical protein